MSSNTNRRFPSRRSICQGNEEKLKHEEMLIYHNDKINFLRDTIKYMFYANSGAIIYVLLKFSDVLKYKVPILIFSFGVSYTILLPVLLYSKTMHIILSCINDNSSPLKWYCDHKTMGIFLRVIIILAIYIPVLAFVSGVMFSGYIMINDSNNIGQ